MVTCPRRTHLMRGRIAPLEKKIGVKIAFGTDLLFDPVTAAKQGRFLAKLKRWFTPYETLKMATSNNAALVGLYGPRNPYQAAPLGVVAEGAYADLILVDGNPKPRSIRARSRDDRQGCITAGPEEESPSRGRGFFASGSSLSDLSLDRFRAPLGREEASTQRWR